MTELRLCERCGEPIIGWPNENHRLRLILLDAVPGPTTDLTGDFHWRCAAEIFHQFNGKTRGDAPPPRAAAGDSGEPGE